MPRKKRSLGDVQDSRGRVDVALYRMAQHTLRRLENEQGLVGLQENILPILESLIAQNVPAENLIPAEIQALMRIIAANQGKRAAT